MNELIQSYVSDSRPLDKVFTLLSNPRRRHVVAALADRSAPVPLQELAAAVAERESSDDSADAVAVDLHHVHLPKLDEADVVDYDTEERVVDARDVDSLAAASPTDE